MLDDQSGSKLGELDNKCRYRLGTSRVIRIKLFISKLPACKVSNYPASLLLSISLQDLVGKLWIVVLFCQNVEEFGHGFGEMLKVSQALHNRSLSSYATSQLSLNRDANQDTYQRLGHDA